MREMLRSSYPVEDTELRVVDVPVAPPQERTDSRPGSAIGRSSGTPCHLCPKSRNTPTVNDGGTPSTDVRPAQDRQQIPSVRRCVSTVEGDHILLRRTVDQGGPSCRGHGLSLPKNLRELRKGRRGSVRVHKLDSRPEHTAVPRRSHWPRARFVRCRFRWSSRCPPLKCLQASVRERVAVLRPVPAFARRAGRRRRLSEQPSFDERVKTGCDVRWVSPDDAGNL